MSPALTASGKVQLGASRNAVQAYPASMLTPGNRGFLQGCQPGVWRSRFSKFRAGCSSYRLSVQFEYQVCPCFSPRSSARLTGRRTCPLHVLQKVRERALPRRWLCRPLTQFLARSDRRRPGTCFSLITQLLLHAHRQRFARRLVLLRSAIPPDS